MLRGHFLPNARLLHNASMLQNEKQLHRVASLTEIPPQTSKTVSVGTQEIAVFNLGGTFYAIDDICPHRGASLGLGFIEGKRVLCPWHLFDFDLQTGACGAMPHWRVSTYEVKVEDDAIYVRL